MKVLSNARVLIVFLIILQIIKAKTDDSVIPQKDDSIKYSQDSSLINEDKYAKNNVWYKTRQLPKKIYDSYKSVRTRIKTRLDDPNRISFAKYLGI